MLAVVALVVVLVVVVVVVVVVVLVVAHTKQTKTHTHTHTPPNSMHDTFHTQGNNCNESTIVANIIRMAEIVAIYG